MVHGPKASPQHLPSVDKLLRLPAVAALLQQHGHTLVAGQARALLDSLRTQALAGALQITSIPTIMAFRDGILVFAQPGALPAPALEDIIAKVRALDMDQVRAQLQARGAEVPATSAAE